MEKLIALDTETTGIEPADGHRVIEIGCVQIIERKIIDKAEYQQYIQPERNVGESVRIHGITDKFLVKKPKFEEIAQEFLEYIQGATLVIHNAPFDLSFLNNELKLMGADSRIEDNCKIIDSLKLSKQQRPGTMHSLDALCRRFEIDSSSRTVHGALLDAQILAQVYIKMTGGQSLMFNETADDNSAPKNKTSTIKFNKNQTKIKVVSANKAELKAHNAYFEGLKKN